MKLQATRISTIVSLTLLLLLTGPNAKALTVLQTDPTGGGMPHENHQPGLGLNYIIALQGIFPSRNAGLADVTPNQEPFLGEITMFAGNFAPRGWAFLDGQTLPINQYSALFSILGTTYGGDGRTTFKLPDMRSRSAMHYGDGPGLTELSLGEPVGVDEVTLTANEMPVHNHIINPPSPTATQTLNAGGGQSHYNMKPGLGINFNVALTGVFPSRSAGTADVEPQNQPFIGDINMFAGNFAPRGYAQTDGQILPINQNSALFSIFGTTYGGDGRTTFGLPDLRGRLSIHEGQGLGLSNNYRLGQKGGEERVQLTLNELPSHDHASEFNVDPAGGSADHNNIQPYQAVNYIVATQGIFPSRSAGAVDVDPNTTDPFIGEVRMFGGNFAPRGWAFADGQLLDIASNTALFSILGTTFGGDGRTTFGLPDLRGRVPVHPGTGPGLRTWSLGEKYGVEYAGLTTAQMPRHFHNYTIPEPGSALLAMVGCGLLLGCQRRCG